MDPVIETKKTLAVFNWLIEEMEGRYKLLQETKARDIDSYNQKQITRKQKIMPRIILAIDELADLMVTYGSNIESMIIRLTQMARATGIHLVLATQRPSVDVVTGLIKANVPNRICFKVASYVDSRTVLDVSGAEKLIGSGDGLFISTFLHRPVRIKSPFITETEIHKVIDFWKEQAEEIPSFEKPTINVEEIEQKLITLEETAEDEELLKQAIEVVLSAGKASTSLLQRRLKIGYARAARLLDLMEEKGIVGPQEGSKPRKVLMTKEDLDNYF
jgi:S-DNA-T family DNA segregation ATPase FtsK/SpoIIIE